MRAAIAKHVPWRPPLPRKNREHEHRRVVAAAEAGGRGQRMADGAGQQRRGAAVEAAHVLDECEHEHRGAAVGEARGRRQSVADGAEPQHQAAVAGQRVGDSIEKASACACTCRQVVGKFRRRALFQVLVELSESAQRTMGETETLP